MEAVQHEGKIDRGLSIIEKPFVAEGLIALGLGYLVYKLIDKFSKSSGPGAAANLGKSAVAAVIGAASEAEDELVFNPLNDSLDAAIQAAAASSDPVLKYAAARSAFVKTWNSENPDDQITIDNAVDKGFPTQDAFIGQIYAASGGGID